MGILVVSGTGTEIGKTVVTAAVAAVATAAGRSVAVLKPAQTGVGPDERGDADEVVRLSGAVGSAELGRFPEPLAPGTAALRAGLAPVGPGQVAEAARKLAAAYDLVLVEGRAGCSSASTRRAARSRTRRRCSAHRSSWSSRPVWARSTRRP